MVWKRSCIVGFSMRAIILMTMLCTSFAEAGPQMHPASAEFDKCPEEVVTKFYEVLNQVEQSLSIQSRHAMDRLSQVSLSKQELTLVQTQLGKIEEVRAQFDRSYRGQESNFTCP